MPTDRVIPLIRQGRLDEAVQVCLEDHAATPQLHAQFAAKFGLSENDPNILKIIDSLNQGHIREMFWIAAAAVKSNDWPRVSKIGKAIQKMPGLDDDGRSPAIMLSLLDFTNLSDLEDQKWVLQQFLMAEMTRLPEATPALTELLTKAKSDETAEVIGVILSMRETCQEKWVPTMEMDMQVAEADLKKDAKTGTSSDKTRPVCPQCGFFLQPDGVCKRCEALRNPQPTATVGATSTSSTRTLPSTYLPNDRMAQYPSLGTTRKQPLNITNALLFPLSNRMGLVIGGVLFLIPVIGWWIIAGFILEVIRCVVSQEVDVMPDWSDIGTKLKEGFMLMVLQIIWFLPFLVFAVILSSLPNADPSFPLPEILGGLATIIVAFFTPVVWGRYAETRQFNSGLQIGSILGMIGRNFGSYVGNWILVAVVIVLASLFAQAAGGVACGIGLIVSWCYSSALAAYMFGHLYLVAKH